MQVLYSVEVPGLGERIKNARLSSRHKGTWLAKTARVSRQSWYQIENETQGSVPLETLKRMEAALEVDLQIPQFPLEPQPFSSEMIRLIEFARALVLEYDRATQPEAEPELINPAEGETGVAEGHPETAPQTPLIDSWEEAIDSPS